jgi:hypothetical protein
VNDAVDVPQEEMRANQNQDIELEEFGSQNNSN